MSPWLRMPPSPDPRSKLHSLVRLSGPFLGADLPPAERRAQVLSRMPPAAPARSAGSSWTRPSTALCLSRLVGHPSKTATPNHVLPVIPGDRNELVECHSEATRGRSPCRPIGQQRSCCDDQLNPPNTPAPTTPPNSRRIASSRAPG